MTFGQVQVTRWFFLRSKMIRCSTLRLLFILVISVFFVLTYLLFTSHKPVLLQATPKHKESIQNFGHGSAILENMRGGKSLQPADPKTEAPVKQKEFNDVHVLASDESVGKTKTYQSENAHDDSGGTTRSSSETHVGNVSSSNPRQGVAPVKCDPSAVVSEMLRLPPIPFLPEYKNPCWRESIDSPIDDLYTNNGFAKYSYSYEKAFKSAKSTLKEQNEVTRTRLRCLPYFLLAGQPKCGSTDFYNRLVQHPDVVAPPTKESHWWGKNRYGACLNYTRTIPFSDYVDLYDGAALEIESLVEDTSIKKDQPYHPVITGDASVSTLWSNDEWWKNPENCGKLEPRFTNAHHVHLVLPQARIIVILRNPTYRLYSDFLYFQKSGKSQEFFHREVVSAIDALTTCMEELGERACVYNHTIASRSRARLRLGLYQVYLQEWMSLFPRKQVMVIRLEDYSTYPLSTIKQAHRFLDLRVLSSDENEEVLEQPLWNTRRESDRKLGGMLEKTKTLLDNFYRPYNLKLAKLLRDDRFLWND